MSKLILKAMGLISVAFISLPTFAANVATSDVTNQAQAKPWHILLDMSHNPATRDDHFTTTDFTTFFDYQLDAKNSFRILVAPTKSYDLAEGQPEWEASDTLLYHFWNTGTSAGPFRLRLVSSLNVPTSVEAQDNDKITTITETLQLNALFMGKFVFSLRPYVRYNWYEFKTTREGNLLPTFIYGANLVTSYSFNDKLSLNGTFGYSIVNELASEYDNSKNLGVFEENAEGRYLISIALNYSMTDKFAVYGGFNQGDIYIKDGRYELYAYDPKISRANAGLTFYF